MKYFLLIVSSLITGWLFIYGAPTALAATEPIISWRAVSYVPAGFIGKVYPTANARVEAAVTLVDGNKIVNLSRNQIQWFLDDAPVGGATGQTSAVFNAGTVYGNHVIRVAISYQGSTIENSRIFSIVKPEIVLTTPAPYQQIAIGKNAFRALPYFFNTTSLQDLRFTWLGNNQLLNLQQSSPDALNINFTSTGSGFSSDFNLTSTIENRLNPLEISTRNISLTIKQ